MLTYCSRTVRLRVSRSRRISSSSTSKIRAPGILVASFKGIDFAFSLFHLDIGTGCACAISVPPVWEDEGAQAMQEGSRASAFSRMLPARFLSPHSSPGQYYLSADHASAA